ncbi:MAG TPA: DNA ligase, partial [Pusillimonas sp.]|nr:DNA ligase [Pusillimonas sp.]
MPKTVIEKVAHLREEIALHNHRYYVLDAPVISDAQYDKLMQELADLEGQYPQLITPESPTQRVGAAPLDAFDSVQHKVPMLSLGNGFEPEDIQAFDRRVAEGLLGSGLLKDSEQVAYHAEYKFDGLAVNLRYEAGRLVQAATRGDG